MKIQGLLRPMIVRPIKTPCVGVCSTGIGGDVCRGCKRYSHEIIAWNSFSHAQKALIDQRLQQFLTQIIRTKLEVLDASLVSQALRQHRIRIRDSYNSYCQAYELLRAGGSRIQDPLEFGLRLLPEVAQLPIVELCRIIDQEFYLLSEAHYQRFFLANRPPSAVLVEAAGKS